MELKTPCNDQFGAGLGPFRTEIIPFGRLGAMVGARGAFHNLPTYPCSSFNIPNVGGLTIAYSAGAREPTTERDTTSVNAGGPTITYSAGDQTADNETNAATDAGGLIITYLAAAGERTAERDTTSADVGGPIIACSAGDQTVDNEANAAAERRCTRRRELHQPGWEEPAVCSWRHRQQHAAVLHEAKDPVRELKCQS